MTWANRNQAWAEVLVDELVRSGVEHATLAPGSRSTPLVLALHDHPAIELHVHVDERSAGFFALGVGKATGTPAVAVTTSGTAAVNLHPAVVEAHQAQVPLLALTADRPHRLRGMDANQTIDQHHLYGRSVRAYHELAPPTIDGPHLRHLRSLACRAAAEARGPPAGPVHLNVPLAKPLEPTPVPGDIPDDFAEDHPLAATGRPGRAPFLRIEPSPATPAPDQLDTLAHRVAEAGRGLIVAGPHPEPRALGPTVLALARATGFPVLADALSGARFQRQAPGLAVAASDLFLQTPEVRDALAPELVLRVGRTPTSKHVARFLEHHNGVDQRLIDDGLHHPDHLAVATEHLRAHAPTTLEALADRVEGTAQTTAWTKAWQQAEATAQQAVDKALAEEPTEALAVRALAGKLPAEVQLLASNSLPVRDLDAYAATRDEPLVAWGNRGASGIDGIVSTAAGIAASRGPTVAVLGDLALLHDTNGLQTVADEGLPLVLLALNNDGGGIFHRLPIREHEPAFTPLFATPHGREPEDAARLHGLPFTQVTEPGQALPAVTEALGTGGPHLVELVCDREGSRQAHEQVVRSVQEMLTHADLEGGS